MIRQTIYDSYCVNTARCRPGYKKIKPVTMNVCCFKSKVAKMFLSVGEAVDCAGEVEITKNEKLRMNSNEVF